MSIKEERIEKAGNKDIYLKLSEVAKLYNMSRDTVEIFIVDNDIPITYAGKDYLINDRVFNEFLSKNKNDRLKERVLKRRKRTRENYIKKVYKNGEVYEQKYNRRRSDEELTKEQLEVRNKYRQKHNQEPMEKYCSLIWVSDYAKGLEYTEYLKLRANEQAQQKYMAITGRGSIENKERHFLFSFDLEKMLDKNVQMSGKKIEKWWNGTINSWTIKDGIWKKENKNNDN